MAWRRQHIRIVLLPRSGRKQPVGFLAHGFGHTAGLAVGPDDAPVLQIDPFPFERDDLGAAASELELLSMPK